jgi:hypothetical protein
MAVKPYIPMAGQRAGAICRILIAAADFGKRVIRGVGSRPSLSDGPGDGHGPRESRLKSPLQTGRVLYITLQLS